MQNKQTTTPQKQTPAKKQHDTKYLAKMTAVFRMRDETRRQRVSLFDLSCEEQFKFSATLHMPTNDCQSAWILTLGLQIYSSK